MMIPRLLITTTVLIGIFAHSVAMAGDREYSNPNDFLSSVTDGKIENFLINSTQADVNGDGHPDWIGIVISRQSEQIQKQTATLYVLLQTPSGNYSIDGESHSFEFHSASGRGWVEIIQVTGNGTFYIQFNARYSCGVEAMQYKFKRVKEDWRLSGLDFLNTNACEDEDKDFSINYLTGHSIEKNTKNGKSLKKKLHTVYPVWYLRDFDYNNRYGTEKFLGNY